MKDVVLVWRWGMFEGWSACVELGGVLVWSCVELGGVFVWRWKMCKKDGGFGGVK